MSCVAADSLGVRLKVRAVPNASKNEVAGLRGDALKIRIQTPPADGRANKELIRFLSKSLGLPKSAITILRGEKSRDKLVGIAGISPSELSAKLAFDPS